jgi:hypothetical protein
VKGTAVKRAAPKAVGVTDRAATSVTPAMVRGALFSARLYADALDEPAVTVAALGALPIDQALDVLTSDGTSQVCRTSPVTRFRVAKALYEGIDRHKPSAFLRDRVTRLGLTSMSQRDWDLSVRPAPARKGDTAASARGDSVLPATAPWSTKVTTAGPQTVITSNVEVEADYLLLAHMADPRRWAENSLFWFRSDRLDARGEPEDPLEPLPADYVPADVPESWLGRLVEQVAGVAIYEAELEIGYEVDDRKCVVTYHLVATSDNITVDEGHLRITRSKQRGWVKTEVRKAVDFTDSPYGGPSSSDLFAPSYMASWLRVQQDLWIAAAARAASHPGPLATVKAWVGPRRPQLKPNPDGSFFPVL